MTSIIAEVESFFHPEVAWAAQEYAKLKSWAGQELKIGEQFIATEAHTIVSGGINLLTAIEPTLLGELTNGWKLVMKGATAGTLDAAGIEQAVIQTLEHLGEDVVAGVKALGSPSLQALFGVFLALGLHL